MPAMKSTLAVALILQLQAFAAHAVAGFTGHAALQAEEQAKWERYTYPKEEFSVEFPAAPSVYHTSWIRGVRDSQRARLYGAYWNGVVFMVVAYDNPSDGQKLDHFVKEFLGRRAPRGQASLQRELMFNAFAGREFSLKVASSGTEDSPGQPIAGLIRIFRAKKHAYMVIAVSEGEGNPTIQRFVESFTLSEKPEGKHVSESPPVVLVEPSPPPTKTELLPLNTGQGPEMVDPDAPPKTTFKAREVARKAVIISKPEPGFTEEARRRNTQGTVSLRLILEADGKVSNISLIKTLPDGLTERAIDAARHIMFLPAMKDGRRVSQWVRIEYNFNIY